MAWRDDAVGEGSAEGEVGGGEGGGMWCRVAAAGKGKGMRRIGVRVLVRMVEIVVTNV